MKNLSEIIVTDWLFNKESVINGNIKEGNLKIKDNSGNGNTLEMIAIGKEENFPNYISWSKNNDYLEFKNKRERMEGIYFKTSIDSRINSLDFKDGYTVELEIDLPKKGYDPWMGILTREGSGKDLGKTKGEVEILQTLSYNDAFQWTGYPLNLEYNPTNWSINVTSENSREGFHHLAIVNDGVKTMMYLNGIADIRNPKENTNGISFIEGKGWLVGAAMWDNQLSSLFSGKLKRIRIANTALDKDNWLVKEHVPTLNLKGSNEKKQLIKDKNNYTFAVIPDSQYMGQSKPEMLTAITEWLVNNKKELNLKMVMHVGDITEESDINEFKNADRYFGILDKGECNYMTTPGNHDYKDLAVNYKRYFGQERFKDNVGFYNDSFNGLNMYSVIRTGSYDYLFISLDYKDIENGVNWAKKIIRENKDKPTIIFTHDCYDERDGRMRRTLNGQFIWDNLISKENSIFMVIAGHEFAVANRVSKNKNGLDVIEMLVNYQDYPSGGNGWIRTLEIDEEKGIYGKTISPWVNSIREEDRTAYDLLHLTSDKDEFFIEFRLKDRFIESKLKIVI